MGESGSNPRAAASSPAPRKPRLVVLTGNPNCGKTTLFNALTGLRAKVGNYPGVTVERKEGRLQGVSASEPVTVLDLPGSYSLSPQSLDEQIARDVLFHRVPEVPPPAVVVVVMDAANLERNLYYATQVIELGHPTVVALNMIDVARDQGHEIDAARLGDLLGVPVLPVVASTAEGLPALKAAILAVRPRTERSLATQRFAEVPLALDAEAEQLAVQLAARFPDSQFCLGVEAALLLSDERLSAADAGRYPPAIVASVHAARQRLEQQGVDWSAAAIEARYARLAAICAAVSTHTLSPTETFSDKLDRVVTHKVWGMLIFLALMLLMFESIFTLAELPMQALEHGVHWLADLTGGWLGPGALRGLITEGVIPGVGAVVVFLPQICLLFMFLGLLEDTGYMARAAFLMDQLMGKVGLHGKSFVPLLSSFACAIPGIMAARTIESQKDRLVTILVAPLIGCSARLPVYTLLIAACIPNIMVLGFLGLPALTLLGMYLLGLVVALLMARLLKKTLLAGPTPMLIMELPPYKRPLLRVVLRHMWDRARLFLQRAGTIILGFNVLLWFLMSYPKHADIQPRYAVLRAEVAAATAAENSGAKPASAQTRDARLTEISQAENREKLERSFAGYLGKAIEPVIAPLGFDWKIGVGILSSFAARENFVSTMSLVYGAGSHHASETDVRSLAQTMQAQKRPDGTPRYSVLTGIALMVFYVFALQCVSTVAVVRRETASWKWPVFQWAYLFLLAWILAFVTYQGGRLFGAR